jgi:hypothetical protein
VKQLPTSVAAGVLALVLAAPGWAQAPMTPSARPGGGAGSPATIPPANNAPSSGGPARQSAAPAAGNAATPSSNAAAGNSAASATTPTTQAPKRTAHRRYYGDTEANALNAAELSRLHGAPVPYPPPAAYPPPYPPPFPFWFPPFWYPRPY